MAPEEVNESHNLYSVSVQEQERPQCVRRGTALKPSCAEVYHATFSATALSKREPFSGHSDSLAA